MLSKDEQKKVIDLVAQKKDLILEEMKKSRVTLKGAADYVTNVDVAVQEQLTKELAREFPEIGMLAEEKENSGFVPEGRYWILDPIDGTTNLIHDYKVSAVALGLYEGGEITFGVVYNPFHDEMFYAAKGEGAYLNGERIHVSAVPGFQDAVFSFGASPYEKEYADEIFPIYCRIFKQSADFRRCGSAQLEICYVACGRAEGYLEKNLKPWDYSAGSVILTEAGGSITDWKGEKVPYLTNSDVLCCAKQFRDTLLGLL